jgi:hypothetical protein
MRDCWLKWLFQANQNKETCSNGCNLRPDSTAVNSWAAKEVLQSKKMIKQKFKKRHYCKWNLQKNFSDFWEISQIPIEDLSK